MLQILKVLPSIAAHPLAVLAYIVVAVAWTFWLFRRSTTQAFLYLLDRAPPDEAKETAEAAGYKWNDLAHLPQNQRLNLLTKRYLLFAFLATTGAAAVILVAAYHAAEGKGVQDELRDQRDSLRKEIETTRASLQKQLDEEKERAALFARGVQGTLSLAAGAAPADKTVAGLADDLSRLLDQYDARFPPGSRDQREELTILIARATLANAHQRYQDALDLVSDVQISNAKEQLLQAHEVRADALCGLEQWDKALAEYQCILDVDPAHLMGLSGKAKCLDELHKDELATTAYGNLINRLTPLLQGNAVAAAYCATTYMGRADCFRKLQQYDKAMEDDGKAVDILTRLVDQEGHREMAQHLALSRLGRGILLSSLGQNKQALGEQSFAIEIYTRLVEKEGRQDLAPDLAFSLFCRGVAYAALEQFQLAEDDDNKAVEIYARLVEKESHAELAEKLSMALLTRAQVFIQRGSRLEASRDLKKAIDLSEDPKFKALTGDLLAEISPPAKTGDK